MKHIISRLALAAIILTGVAANAAEATKKSNTPTSTINPTIRPYIGLDLGYSYTKNTGPYSSVHRISTMPNAGLRIGDYFGVEAGYLSFIPQPRKSQYDPVKAHAGALYLDGRAYAPITKSLEAIASVGVGKYTTSTNKPILRLGGGLQYNINKNLGVRSMLHYNINTKPITKHNVWMPTIGVNYTF